MIRRLKQMLIKEFIQVFRDKRTRFVLFVPPIVQMLIFGYAAVYEINHVTTAVLDLDQFPVVGHVDAVAVERNLDLPVRPGVDLFQLSM